MTWHMVKYDNEKAVKEKGRSIIIASILAIVIIIKRVKQDKGKNF